MVTPRRTRFLGAQLAVLVTVVLLLAVLDALAYDLFFLVALIGFLVVAELTSPFRVAPDWRSGIKWVAAAGLTVFAAIVTLRTIEIVRGAL